MPMASSARVRPGPLQLENSCMAPETLLAAICSAFVQAASAALGTCVTVPAVVVAFALGSVAALVAGGVSEATSVGVDELGRAIEGPGSALELPLLILITMPTIAATATTATMPMIGPALLFF